jgi:hypothetical protein
MKRIRKHLEGQAESTSGKEGLDQGFNLAVVERVIRNVEKYSSRGPKVVQGGLLYLLDAVRDVFLASLDHQQDPLYEALWGEQLKVRSPTGDATWCRAINCNGGVCMEGAESRF